MLTAMTKVPAVLFDIADASPAKDLQVVVGAEELLRAWTALQASSSLLSTSLNQVEETMRPTRAYFILIIVSIMISTILKLAVVAAAAAAACHGRWTSK